MLLTIGQLAEHCGVTVRAVRHYHQCGLLAEPGRDGSGYRRYGAQAVVDLVRIKALADAGVPLSEVRRLLGAAEGDFAAAVADIDGRLHDQVLALERRREQLKALLSGDRMVLSADVVELLDDLRAMGVSAWNVALERDGWILLTAICPHLVPEWARQKRAAMTDPEFCRLYLACDQAHEWDIDDPRLYELAAWMSDWATKRREAVIGAIQEAPDDPGISVVETLMTSQLASASPAFRRLGELSRAVLTEAARDGLDA